MTEGFSESERNLVDWLVKLGVKDEVAETFTHALVEYMLGYITERGVGKSLIDAGASEQLALAAARKFRALKAAQTEAQENFANSNTAPAKGGVSTLAIV